MTFTQRIIRTLFLFTTLTLLAIGTFAQNPDGDLIERGNEIHDQRAGSMLIYNYYTSYDSITPGTQNQNTRISITNTNVTTGITVKFSFVNGMQGQAVFGGLSLAPGQTQSFLTSDVDPGTTGYIIAIATNDSGEPIQFDYLIGLATITLASGHQATLGALAVPINANGTYAALPRQLALDQVPSPQDTAERLLIINRVDGNLINGMPAIGTLQVDLFNDLGNSLRFTSFTQGPQAKVFAGQLFTRRVNWTFFLRAGHYGWLRLRPTGEGAITGAVLYFNRNPATGVASPVPGSYNLRHLTNTQATLQTISSTLLFGY